MHPYLYSTVQPSSVPALAFHEPATPMPSNMTFNPVTDNFTNIQPTQPTQPTLTVCPPAPVSVSHTHAHMHIFYFSESAIMPIF